MLREGLACVEYYEKRGKGFHNALSYEIGSLAILLPPLKLRGGEEGLWNRHWPIFP